MGWETHDLADEASVRPNVEGAGPPGPTDHRQTKNASYCRKGDGVKISERGEFGLIRSIRMLLERPEEGLVCGAGDDAAVFRGGRGELFAYTADALVEGVHFDLRYTSWHSLGYKALAVNLSDLASMGGGGLSYALVVLGLRGDEETAWIEEMYRGMLECGRRYSCRLAGGDVVRSPGETFLSISLVGVLPEGRFLSRGAALPGQVILVTGTLGDSYLGMRWLKQGGDADNHCARRHLYPHPRLREGRAAVRGGAAAAIDISDGLLRDLGHICEESGVGAEIRMADIPVSEEARRVAHGLGLDPMEAALHGGEDYELLLTAPPELAHRLAGALPAKPIGRIREEPGVSVLDLEGAEVAITRTGYEHFGGE